MIVEILDIVSPEAGVIDAEHYNYTRFDLLNMDVSITESLADDKSVNLLMITAGFGRVAEFDQFHISEISKMMTVNATSTIQLLRCFYERIKNDEKFYCGVMCSISGMMSSPMATVYSASKAAVCRLIEGVNIELEENGSSNRILNVSPASFKGSKFYGGENDLNELNELSDSILTNLFNSSELFIPMYEEIFKGVLERYHNDPHEYGLYSYEYKKKSGRVDNEKHAVIGYLSGTFDLFHVGHLNILKRAKEQCDYLIVGVHENGAWKGKETFIPFEERKDIVRSCRYVDKVVNSCVEDSDAWGLWHYDRLFVGSDYKNTERFLRYEEYFKDKGVEIVYFPYTQSTSSTQIRKIISMQTNEAKADND